MFWLMICRHNDDATGIRAAAREAHRAHVATGGDGAASVLVGSALVADGGDDPLGNFGIIEAPTREAAMAFAEQDPYNRAGLVATIEVIALAERFGVQAEQIVRLTKR